MLKLLFLVHKFSLIKYKNNLQAQLERKIHERKDHLMKIQ